MAASSPPGVVGLVNGGNTCYASAVLQAMANCPLPSAQHRLCPPSEPKSIHGLIQRLHAQYRRGETDATLSAELSAAVRASNSVVLPGPEDSQSFLTVVVDALCEPAKRAFTGATRSMLSCDACEHTSETTEEFTTLMFDSFSGEGGIAKAYERWSRWEFLPDAVCEKCQHHGMHKNIFVKRTPDVLVLMQRTPGTVTMAEIRRSAKTHSLWAVVCYNSGHYVCVVRSAKDGAWYIVNDARVHPVREPPTQFNGSYLMFFARNQ